MLHFIFGAKSARELLIKSVSQKNFEGGCNMRSQEFYECPECGCEDLITRTAHQLKGNKSILYDRRTLKEVENEKDECRNCGLIMEYKNNGKVKTYYEE